MNTKQHLSPARKADILRTFFRTTVGPIFPEAFVPSPYGVDQNTGGKFTQTDICSCFASKVNELMFNRLFWSFKLYIVNLNKRPAKLWSFIQHGLMSLNQGFGVPKCNDR